MSNADATPVTGDLVAVPDSLRDAILRTAACEVASAGAALERLGFDSDDERTAHRAKRAEIREMIDHVEALEAGQALPRPLAKQWATTAAEESLLVARDEVDEDDANPADAYRLVGYLAVSKKLNHYAFGL